MDSIAVHILNTYLSDNFSDVSDVDQEVNFMTVPILVEKEGVQRELELPFSIWITKDDLDHMARRIYEAMELWDKYNIEEGWLDVYEIDRGRTKTPPVSWAHGTEATSPFDDQGRVNVVKIAEREAAEREEPELDDQVQF